MKYPKYTRAIVFKFRDEDNGEHTSYREYHESEEAYNLALKTIRTKDKTAVGFWECNLIFERENVIEILKHIAKEAVLAPDADNQLIAEVYDVSKKGKRPLFFTLYRDSWQTYRIIKSKIKPTQLHRVVIEALKECIGAVDKNAEIIEPQKFTPVAYDSA